MANSRIYLLTYNGEWISSCHNSFEDLKKAYKEEIRDVEYNRHGIRIFKTYSDKILIYYEVFNHEN